jgi:hypothetical protein
MEPVKTPKQRQREEEANHEQELEHIKGHTHSRCFKWEALRSSLRSKDKESHQCCQAIGREVRIVHHHETLYPLPEQAKELPRPSRASCLVEQ